MIKIIKSIINDYQVRVRVRVRVTKKAIYYCAIIIIKEAAV
jgi:hypothetical protein